MKSVIIVAALMATSVAAHAGSWNSQQNLQKAVTAGVSAYNSGGLAAVASASENCFKGLDIGWQNKDVQRDVEYCIALESTGLVIHNTASNLKANATYFDSDETLFAHWMNTLESARIVELPEQFKPYLIPRLQTVSSLVKKQLKS